MQHEILNAKDFLNKWWEYKELKACKCPGNLAYISDQLFAAANSTAFSTSPMDRYISAAAFGSLILFAHSAFFSIRDLLSWTSDEDRNS